ncbi:Fe-S cluster assembly sulfur transfer protein SufU [Ferrovum sp.]|jgi:nitrogen fixation NifU-like protein|uniref:Fe-S cluster assembly sulfur transfer protein SufU n=1 Tax=Ferrovum sp. TaxID=2609467 RepID=UPI00262F7406|nr:SUF system NifU family Fe-S cluster assembly protein [Ferrovum sp.]MBW8066292.1 SUF system NifU family Fe-S cluster assembly protein [Ferrovum sp.]
MSDLRDLYQEVIFDHNRHPRNFGPLPGANRHADGFNALCGDKLSLNLKVEDGIIQEARFEGSGCAISTASASLMTEALKGRRETEVAELFEGFHHMVKGEPYTVEMGKLAVLAGVSEFPARVKCATLAWHTLNAALHQADQPVSTE